MRTDSVHKGHQANYMEGPTPTFPLVFRFPCGSRSRSSLKKVRFGTREGCFVACGSSAPTLS